jgi:signal transduction histidine kinase
MGTGADVEHTARGAPGGGPEAWARLRERVDGRLPEPVEVAAYYLVSGMLANAARHARAEVVRVDARSCGGTLQVRVRDDGIGGADPARGSGLVSLKDRIEALGGTFSVQCPAGHGTTVTCELPATADGRHLDAYPVT